jgi:transposase
LVADPEFRLIRLHTRYRRDLTGERTRDKQRVEKLPEDAALKISWVLTGLHGMTGRDIMDHLIAGERNPEVLARLARKRARAKIAQLEEALEGAEFFTAARAALLKAMLERIDRVTAETGQLGQVIGELPAPYQEQLQQAGSMPGRARRPARDAIAETGADMTRFTSGAHLASRAGRTPLDRQSGARQGKARRKRGNRYLGAVPGETATAAGRTQAREGTRHRRIARGRGAARACVATGNTQMKVFCALLSNPGTRYTDPGPDWNDNARQAARRIKHHIGAPGAMGYEVTPSRTPQAAPGQEPAPAT